MKSKRYTQKAKKKIGTWQYQSECGVLIGLYVIIHTLHWRHQINAQAMCEEAVCTQMAKWAVFPNFTRKILEYSLKNTDFSINVAKLVLIKIEINTNRDDYFIIQNRKVDVPEWNPFGRLVRVDLENCAYFWKICSYACWQEDEVLLNWIWVLTVWWFTIRHEQEFK